MKVTLLAYISEPKHWVDLTACGTGLGVAVNTFFQIVQGPITVIAATMSALWLGRQLYLSFKKDK